MQMTNDNYRPCVFAVCSCWDGSAAAHSGLTPLGLQVHCDSPSTAVRRATWALSFCLLQPSARFPDAVADALRQTGGCGDRLVADLNACMSSRRWFIRWEAIEKMYAAALAASFGKATCSASSAKVQRRSHTEKKQQAAPQHALHRPNCPCVAPKQPTKRRPRMEKTQPESHCVANTDQSTKRARLGGA